MQLACLSTLAICAGVTVLAVPSSADLPALSGCASPRFERSSCVRTEGGSVWGSGPVEGEGGTSDEISEGPVASGAGETGSGEGADAASICGGGGTSTLRSGGSATGASSASSISSTSRGVVSAGRN